MIMARSAGAGPTRSRSPAETASVSRCRRIERASVAPGGGTRLLLQSSRRTLAGGWPRPGLKGIEAIVFRTIGDRPALWESLLPAGVLGLPDDLARMDALLDEPGVRNTSRAPTRPGDLANEHERAP